jgi:hypothetical protein
VAEAFPTAAGPVLEMLHRTPRAVVARVSGGVAKHYLPESAGAPSSSAMLHAAWAASELVGPALFPRVLQAWPDERLLLMEDLGGGPSLVDVLAGADGEAGAAALVEHARTLGRVAALTAGREAEHRALVARHGGAPLPPLIDPTDVALAGAARAAAALGVRAEPAVAGDATRAGARLEAGGPRSLSPGDTCPDNNRVGPPFRLIDLDYAGFRHPARDAAYHWIPFPTCWFAGRVPAPVLARARAAFVAEQPVDDEDCVAACADWTLQNLQWLLPGAIETDRQLAENGPVSVREMLAWRCEAFAALAEEAGRLRALGAWCGRLAAAMRERWSPGPVALYPCFGRPSGDPS